MINVYQLLLLQALFSLTLSATPPVASVTPLPPGVLPIPDVKNGNILCNTPNKDTLAFADCNKFSDSKYACCLAETTDEGSKIIKESSFQPDTTFKTKTCFSIQARSDPYPTLQTIGGLEYRITCPSPINEAFTKSITYTFVRGTKCGPNRAYAASDCSEYNLSDNTCCKATIRVDSDFELNTCFFWGQAYNYTLWNTVIGANVEQAKDPKKVILNDDGLPKDGIDQFSKKNIDDYIFQPNQIGYANIYCPSYDLFYTVILAIFFAVILF